MFLIYALLIGGAVEYKQYGLATVWAVLFQCYAIGKILGALSPLEKEDK